MEITVMKKICILLVVALALTGCYEDYVREYDHDGVFFAYQYDLRTFVIGEDAAFDVTVALGGVMKNGRDRAVKLAIDNTLVNGDAYRGMMGTSQISGDYVGAAFRSAGVTSVEPLPASDFTVTGLDGLKIPAGRHTGTVTIHATDDLISDPNAYKPGYALGVKILSADADEVVEGMDFSVIAVRCENRFFGNWTHHGTITTFDESGKEVQKVREVGSLADDSVYSLQTVDANTLTCGKMTGMVGGMRLAFTGDDIAVSSANGAVTGTGRFNGAKLLQERELFLEYDLPASGGGRKNVRDTLCFRNRIRDGINEWQDENKEHYK